MSIAKIYNFINVNHPKSGSIYMHKCIINSIGAECTYIGYLNCILHAERWYSQYHPKQDIVRIVKTDNHF